ncbi:MAG: histidine kinase [Mariniphaga sp.]|nr:histidine kinase [Mariniphaga sp.]
MPGKKPPILFRYRILWHILFWITVYVMYSVTYGGYWCHYYEEFIINLILMPVRIIGTYVLLYMLIPLLLVKRWFFSFFFFALIHAFLYGFVIWITMYLSNLFPYYTDYSVYKLFYFPKIFNAIISNYGISVLATAVLIFKKWFTDEQTRRKLAIEKHEAELKFLKAQIHPHFLFNTLNNLYGLTLIKSDKTPDIVLKLSGLLDYMLYKSNDDFVPLEKEIEILKSYIELEKIRYDNRLDLEFKIEGQSQNHQIAPLILLPFIENSFKHGASSDRSKPVIIILMLVKKDYLFLNVKNTVPASSKADKDYGEGIGLKNVRRRLELIYPDLFLLELDDKKSSYEVNLKIYWKEIKSIV